MKWHGGRSNFTSPKKNPCSTRWILLVIRAIAVGIECPISAARNGEHWVMGEIRRVKKKVGEGGGEGGRKSCGSGDRGYDLKRGKIIRAGKERMAGRNNKEVGYGNWDEIELGNVVHWDVETSGRQRSFDDVPPMVFETWEILGLCFLLSRLSTMLKITSITERISR